MARQPRQPATSEEMSGSREHLEDLLDEALRESFPASDPLAVTDPATSVGASLRPEPGTVSDSGDSAKARLDYGKASPQGLAAFRHLNTYVGSCGLEHSLLELVKTRASQINGCAYCLDMHTKDARAAGETEQRLFTLSAWRETPFFSERERAALAWTEAVTCLAGHPVEDALYDDVRKHFSEKETVDLTLAIIAINGWNRLAISFRTPPGSYRPKG